MLFIHEQYVIKKATTILGKMREKFGPFPKIFGFFLKISIFYSNLIKKSDLCKKLTKCSPHFSSVQLSIKKSVQRILSYFNPFSTQNALQKRDMPKVQKKTEITHAHVTFIPFDSQIKKQKHHKIETYTLSCSSR